MNLGPEELEKVTSFLKSKGVGKCPACGGTEITVNGMVLNQFFDGKKPLNTCFCSVPIVCKNCGNVQFYGAEQLGLTHYGMPMEKE